MSDIDNLLARLAEAPPDAGVWSVRVSTLRKLLRLLDEARAREDSCLAALLKIRVEMGLHRDSGDDLAVHAGQLLAERNVARADLARVTQELEQSRTNEAHAWNMQVATEAERDYLAAKLARAEATLDFAARTLRGEGCEDQEQAYDIAQRAIDAYFAASDEEPRISVDALVVGVSIVCAVIAVWVAM